MTPAAKRLRVIRVTRAMGEEFVPYRMHHLIRITIDARRREQERTAALHRALTSIVQKIQAEEAASNPPERTQQWLQ